MTRILDLSAIDETYFDASGFAARIMSSLYQVGGSRRTLQNARREAIGAFLGVYMSDQCSLVAYSEHVTVQTTDCLSVAILQGIMDSVIQFEGRSYRFHAMDAVAEEVGGYEGPEIFRAIEIRFEPIA